MSISVDADEVALSLRESFGADVLRVGAPNRAAAAAALSAAHEMLYGTEACLMKTFGAEYMAWDRAIRDQLNLDVPRSWFYFEDIRSINEKSDALLYRVLTDLGVLGLEAWDPLITARRYVDNFWMRPGYLVICDPPYDITWTPADDSGAGECIVRWADGWTVHSDRPSILTGGAH